MRWREIQCVGTGTQVGRGVVEIGIGWTLVEDIRMERILRKG